MAAHGFVGRRCSSDLGQLHEHEHEDPGELQRAPSVGYDGEWIFGVLVANFASEDGAVRFCR